LHIDRALFLTFDQAGAFFDVGLLLPRTDFYLCSFNSGKERFHRKAWAVES
jgi:hypothetical protein